MMEGMLSYTTKSPDPFHLSLIRTKTTQLMRVRLQEKRKDL